MNRRLSAFASVTLVAFGVVAVACSSDDSGAGGTGGTSAGPLDGTFAAQDDTGSAPFDSITFFDSAHYSYIARGCGARDPSADGDLGEDTSWAVNPTSACIHQGTYVIENNGVTLTDDGQTSSISVPIVVTGTTAADGGGGVDSQALRPKSGQLAPQDVPPVLVTPGGPLSGSGTVTNITAMGTPLAKSSGQSGSLVTAGAVANALQWANVQMPYCWAINHGMDTDSDCVKIHGKTCERTGKADNPVWNAYRSDCSGLVSFAWGLAPPGKNTNGFVSGIASHIAAQDLQSGDALLAPGKHIGLFEKWIDQSAGRAMMIAEPGCTHSTPYAQEQEWSIVGGTAPGKAPNNTWNDGEETSTFFAIRKH